MNNRRSLFARCLAAGVLAGSTITSVRVAEAVIEKKGIIVADESWGSGDVYLITGDVTVAAGVTLSISSGAVVKFKAESGACRQKHSIIVDGDLEVAGSAASPVTFTSGRDDTIAGDSNADGVATVPAPRDWQSIRFNPGSRGTLNRLQIRYGGGVSGECGDVVGAIYLDGSSPSITNLSARDLGWSAISAHPSDHPTIAGFTATKSPIGGLEIRGGSVLADASWDQAEVVYVPTGNIAVNSGGTLNITAGVTVKMLSASSSCGIRRSLNIEGTLNVAGTAERPVVFTSSRDDTVVGDTNGDAMQTVASARDWESIRFNLGSTGTIQHAQIRYAGGVSNECSESVGAIYLDGSSPSFDQLTVRDLARSAISANPSDHPLVTNFRATRTPIGGLEMRAGTLIGEGKWDQPDIVYVPTGNIGVNDGAKLTVGPGVVVKFQTEGNICRVKHSISVDGGFEATGTMERPVVFSSSRDDATVGDTNGDGMSTVAAARDWESIRLNPGSNARMSHTQIRYGGGVSSECGDTVGTIVVDGTNPVFSDLSARDLGWSAISMAPSDHPTVAGLTSARVPLGGIEIRGGALLGNATWDQVGIAYMPSGNVTVTTGSTLAIAPGVTVKFLAIGNLCRAKYGIDVQGTLRAVGAPDRKIQFTSSRDDTVIGDSNGDRSETTPAARDWQSLRFSAGSQGDIQHADIRYGGGLSNDCGGVVGAVSVEDASPSIQRSMLRDNAIALLASGRFAVPRINFSNLVGNTTRAIDSRDGARVDATNNWWGLASGPATGAIAGTDVDTSNPLPGPFDMATPIPTVSPSPSPSPTRTISMCAGDCDRDGKIEIEEVRAALRITLGGASTPLCDSVDRNADGAVTIEEVVYQVKGARGGC